VTDDRRQRDKPGYEEMRRVAISEIACDIAILPNNVF